MDYLFQYGLFLAQAVTLVAAILLVVGGIASIAMRQKEDADGHIEIRHINEKYRHISDTLRQVVEDPEAVKADLKARKKSEKAEHKAAKKKAKSKDKQQDPEEEQSSKPRLFVLDFEGDIKASAVDNLREEITAVLLQADSGDEVLVKLESPGGMVHSYGLAASQLQRIPDAGVSLTVAVDKVAASGGYMMACVASRIIAAPFAVIGSIGVLAQLPNFNKLLKKHDIDYELFTAGEYKRTVTMLGENTEKGREKFREELEDTHVLFKDYVQEHRPNLDIARVATGEVWYGRRAIDVGLVDDLQTSDAYVQAAVQEREVYEVRFQQKKNWQEKLGVAAQGAIERSVAKLWQQGRSNGQF